MICRVFTLPPPDFKPRVEVASCYCTWEKKLLLLQRSPHKSQGNTWGVPAGKLEKGEDALTALVRELFEEIGVKVEKKYLEPIQTLYICQSSGDFVYHMFYLALMEEPTIILGLQEHQTYKWATLEEAFQSDLMAGEEETLQFYQAFLQKKESTHQLKEG